MLQHLVCRLLLVLRLVSALRGKIYELCTGNFTCCLTILLFIGTLFNDAVKPEDATRGRVNLTGWSIKVEEEFATLPTFEVKNSEKPLTPD